MEKGNLNRELLNLFRQIENYEDKERIIAFLKNHVERGLKNNDNRKIEIGFLPNPSNDTRAFNPGYNRPQADKIRSYGIDRGEAERITEEKQEQAFVV